MVTQTADVQKEFPCKVVQMLTDSGPDAKNCRKQISQKFPEVVTGSCVSHTLDLFIEDLLDVSWAAGQ